MNDRDEFDFIYLHDRYDVITALVQHIMTELIHIKNSLKEIRSVNYTGNPSDKIEPITSINPISTTARSVDDLFDLNLIDANVPLNDRQMTSAVWFAMRLEFLYEKNSRGSYNHKLANAMAYNFIARHDRNDQERLVAWAEKHALDLTGLCRITSDLFPYLWGRMQASSASSD